MKSDKKNGENVISITFPEAENFCFQAQTELNIGNTDS